MNDPGPTAEALLAQEVGDLAVPHPASPEFSFGGHRSGRIDLAGLTYRLDMPPGWAGRVEPFEDYTVAWREEDNGTVMRMENQKRLGIWRWAAVPPGTTGLASINIRGILSPSAFVLLRATWVDEERQIVGTENTVRLHEGPHPKWRPLRLALHPPEGAAFVRYRVTAFHMMPGDWIELRDPDLTWYWTASESSAR